MGVSSSKIGKNVEKMIEPQEGSIPSTPILTPKILKNNELDPRSPSTFISRTPIEILTAAAEKLENFKDVNTDTPIRNKHLSLGIDPRSPTTEFKRTPILINNEENVMPKVILNKNLEKVIQSELRTPKLKKEQTNTNIIPPKLLDSSPVPPKPEAYKRKSFVGLLETNIDFTETDIDAVFLEKCKGVIMESSKNTNKIDIVENKNVDPRSPTTQFIRTPIQIVKKIGEIELNDEDDTSVTEQIHDTIEHVTVIEVKNDNVPEADSKVVEHEENNAENVDIMVSVDENSDDIILKQDVDEQQSPEEFTNKIEFVEVINTYEENNLEDQPKSAPVSPPQMDLFEEELIPNRHVKSAPITPPRNTLISNIQSVDRKLLTQLIYEDDIIVCPRVVKLKDYNDRSPLKNRNGIEPDKKRSAQKLKVSDRPRKGDIVCKIPVYRENNKKQSVQCENTPPRKMEMKKKSKPCLWDTADKTLYL